MNDCHLNVSPVTILILILIFYNLCPSYLQKNVVPLRDVHHHNTRSGGYNFLVPNCPGVEDSTFHYTGIKDWNSLYEWLKHIESPQKFKNSSQEISDWILLCN